MSHGLSDHTVGRIAGVFARFPEVESAVLFGSRANEHTDPEVAAHIRRVGLPLNRRESSAAQPAPA